MVVNWRADSWAIVKKRKLRPGERNEDGVRVELSSENFDSERLKENCEMRATPWNCFRSRTALEKWKNPQTQVLLYSPPTSDCEPTSRLSAKVGTRQGNC
jgi:hypothetical protein